MNVSDIKSEWIWHHSTRNNIRKNDTELPGTMHYDIFRSITRLQVGIYYGTVAFYCDLPRKTVSDIKSEWIWHHSTLNNIRKNDTGLTGTMHYDIFRSITHYKRFGCIRYTASTNSAYYSILYLYTQTNHVCDFITLNYTSMTHCVGIY